MQRLQTDFMQIDFNQAMLCSVVSPTSKSLIVTALFRTTVDFAGLMFYSDEPRMHADVKYPCDYDYTDTVLEFDVEYTGAVMPFDESIEYEITGNGEEEPVKGRFTPSLTVECTNGETYYPYMEELTSDSYHYKIEFNNLYESKGSRTNENGEVEKIKEKVPCDSIAKIMFPIIPKFYNATLPNTEQGYTGNSTPGTISFYNWTISGGNLGEEPKDKFPNGYRIAEGYDDEYYHNPKRIIDSIYKLGYRDAIDLYIGASHYYDFYGIGKNVTDYQSQYMITSVGINKAFASWFTYFCKESYEKGFKQITVSVSMESLHVPDLWQQKMFDGVAGRTGWEPPTYFYSPTNPEVRTYYNKICTDVLDIIITNNLKPILQLGEPWWWWQEFYPGDVSKPYPNRPPCFYDSYTVQKFKSEFGYDMPRFAASEINMDNYAHIIEWLQNQLGDFSNFVKSIVKNSKYNGEYTVLFFPPSVLDTYRVPVAIRTVNVPVEQWKYPNLDFIQIEDYDWLINENDGHDAIYNFPVNFFNYPIEKVEYFSGFAWEQYTVNLNNDKEDITYVGTIDTSNGQYYLKPKDGAYIYVNTANINAGIYNSILLRSEEYTFADKMYLQNKGPAGIAIHYVDASWGMPILIGYLDPNKNVVLIFNGWGATNMWTWGVVEEWGKDAKITNTESTALTEKIPINYQWGLIENGARMALKNGIKNVYIWAGTQIRRDSWTPSSLYYKSKVGVEMTDLIYNSNPFVENDGMTHEAEVYIEMGWKDNGKYEGRKNDK